MDGGLRERKKARTRDTIAATAVELFLTHGYDAVSVNDVAAAAEISKPTLFRYFPSKEDLVVHRFADHAGEHARTVHGRAPDEAPLDALHRHFRDGLDRRDPVTGLNDLPHVLAFHRLVFETPALADRINRYQAADERALAEALGGGLDGLLLAAQTLAVHRVLARTNWERLAAGRTADELHPVAVADASRAFGLLTAAAWSSTVDGGRRR